MGMGRGPSPWQTTGRERYASAQSPSARACSSWSCKSGFSASSALMHSCGGRAGISWTVRLTSYL
eukprot:6194481-Alexandrium_andersonii.AAC.1